MKFTFDRDAMIREVSIAQEIISSTKVEEIRSNIALYAYNNTLTIKATDTKVNFETNIPVQIQEEGETTVYCDKFMGILTALPDGEIEFNQPVNTDSEQSITVFIKPLAKKIKFQIKSRSADKFPNFSSADDVPYFEVPSKEIKEMISQTYFAVSEDITRLFMNGIYFEKKGDRLQLVATDGRRLSFASKELLAGVSDFPAVIVPPKIMQIVLKRAPDEGNISIAVVDKMIFFRFANYKFGSVLLDGQFPNYDRVIPEHQEHSFQVQKEDLIGAFKRVALMVDKKAGKIYFDLSDGLLKITSPQSDMGSADEEIPCQYAGAPCSLTFNFRYLEEPMKAIPNDRLTFEFTEEYKQVTLRPEPAGDYFHIIMPMHRD